MKAHAIIVQEITSAVTLRTKHPFPRPVRNHGPRARAPATYKLRCPLVYPRAGVKLVKIYKRKLAALANPTRKPACIYTDEKARPPHTLYTRTRCRLSSRAASARAKRERAHTSDTEGTRETRLSPRRTGTIRSGNSPNTPKPRVTSHRA